MPPQVQDLSSPQTDTPQRTNQVQQHDVNIGNLKKSKKNLKNDSCCRVFTNKINKTLEGIFERFVVVFF